MKGRVAIVCVVAYLAAWRTDIDGAMDYFHEGERLAQVDALRAGKLPFRDIYIQHGLGEDVLKPLLACRIYGTHVSALRRLGMNAYLHRGLLPPLGFVAAIIAVAALSRRWQAAVIAAILLLVAWVELTDRHVLGLLSVAAAGQYLHTRRGAWLAGAGALAALAAQYSLDVGLFAAVAVTAWCALDTYVAPQAGSRPRAFVVRWAWLTAGAVAAATPLLIWCAEHGIVDDLARNVYWQVFVRDEAMPMPYPRPWWNHETLEPANLYDGLRTFMLYYAAPLATVAVAIVAFRRRGWPAAMRSALLLAAAAAAAFWLSVVGRPDAWHIGYAAGPFIILVTLVLLPVISWTLPTLKWRALRNRQPLAGLFVMPGLIMLMGMAHGGVAGHRYTGAEHASVPERLRPAAAAQAGAVCDVPRVGGLKMPAHEARFAEIVCRYIQENCPPGQAMLDLSDCGLFYFLAERPCPTRFYFKFHVGRSPRLRDRMAADVLAAPTLPPLAITRAGDEFAALINAKPADDPADSLNADPLARLLMTHYEPTDSIAYLQFWRRRGGGG